jgi:hypothetical protein
MSWFGYAPAPQRDALLAAQLARAPAEEPGDIATPFGVWIAGADASPDLQFWTPGRSLDLWISGVFSSGEELLAWLEAVAAGEDAAYGFYMEPGWACLSARGRAAPQCAGLHPNDKRRPALETRDVRFDVYEETAEGLRLSLSVRAPRLAFVARFYSAWLISFAPAPDGVKRPPTPPIRSARLDALMAQALGLGGG